jgi:hypothetical protein
MNFDPTTHSVLLFGGISGAQNHDFLADTWSWNGVAWTRLEPVSGPPSRDKAAMVASTSNGRVLLIGGQAADGSVLSDTWAWDGKTWATFPSPGPRLGAGAVDAGSQVLVFGGSTNHATNDVLSWDGATWSVR